MSNTPLTNTTVVPLRKPLKPQIAPVELLSGRQQQTVAALIQCLHEFEAQAASEKPLLGFFFLKEILIQASPQGDGNSIQAKPTGCKIKVL